MAAHPMQPLGLTTVEEDVYRHLLRNPGTELSSIYLLLRREREDVVNAVNRLRERRMIRMEGLLAWPLDPEQVVPRLAERRLESLYQDIRALTHLKPILDSLGGERSRPAPDENPEGAPAVERVTDLSRIRALIDELAFFARTEVLGAEPYTALTPENIQHSRPLDLRCLRRGVSLRNLVRKEALDDPATVAYLWELTTAGARIRVLDDLSELILVYDGHTALVPLDPRDSSKGALCTREAALVTNFVERFERLWESARDFTECTSDAAKTEPELPEVQRRVLESMCTAAKDETRARDVGVSLRTYRRHVADLMNELGAENRAHAALLARERGWL
ncbi:helix-turn-helix transcriptional regulator [Streptomyces sp. NPDC018693]|uniref:helix-turn-helix transcriptional regulator n=1 Tax=unclassified Streptomyces TaxID=2593676 RepID=UPI00379E6900